MDEIINPTLRAMKVLGAPYKGVLFAGLMITGAGPKLIEYNVRFGDPETQVMMLRLMSDLVPALIAARDGQRAVAQPVFVRRRHIRKSRAQAIVIDANQWVAIHEVDMVVDDHHLAGGEIWIQAAGSVRQD